jgi:uncharacterized protein (TIGR02284 family)
MSGTQHTIDVLEKLITVCRDGEMGYLHAAAHVEDPSLQTFFREQSLERARFARELSELMGSIGEKPSDTSGSLAGALHRAWFAIKGDLGGGEHTILESVEQGEDAAKKAYEEALNSPLPEEVAALIRTQYASVKAAHDSTRRQRDQKAA